eukprot:4767820-Prymnesium_polylepis.1
MPRGEAPHSERCGVMGLDGAQGVGVVAAAAFALRGIAHPGEHAQHRTQAPKHGTRTCTHPGGAHGIRAMSCRVRVRSSASATAVRFPLLGMDSAKMLGNASLTPPRYAPRIVALAGLALFLGGVGVGVGAGVGITRRTDAVQTKVDFTFQILGLDTPRQLKKTMDVFVRLRYPEDSAHCPFSPTDNDCIQYQLKMRQLILNITLRPEPWNVPMGAEWERVTLALCRSIYDEFDVAAVSTLVQVNGDGRNATERGGAPYEPGAHSATCTIGPPDFAPIDRYNHLPNFGGY